MPAELDRCVRQLRKDGVPEDRAFAICTASLNKASKLEENDEVIREAQDMAVKLAQHTCPPGMTHVDGRCVKKDAVELSKHKKKKKKRPVGYMELEELKGVEVLRTGNIRGKKVDKAFLDEIVANTQELMKQDLHSPPGKLGHDEDQLFARVSGLPATGWVESLKRVGDRLIVNFTDMPKIVKEALEKKLFKKISAEVWFELPHPTTGKNIAPVLRAVAFLGADIPEIKGLRAFLSEDFEPLKLTEGDHVSMTDVNININIPNGDGEDPEIDMEGFIPGGDSTIVGDPNKLTAEGLDEHDLEMFREAERVVAAMVVNQTVLPGFKDAPTVDSLMRWVGSVGFGACLSTPEIRSIAVDPERLCSWLQERANERGLLLASETNKEETQMPATEELTKLQDEVKEAGVKLATAKEEGKATTEKLSEMTKKHDSLQGKFKAAKLSEQNECIAKFKEDHKETLIPALHPDFDALCDMVREGDEVVVKLSETKSENLDPIALVMRLVDSALKAKVVKLGELAKGKKTTGTVKKFAEIKGATKGVALDTAAMELIQEDSVLKELYSKNANAAYNEACNRVREANPDIEDEEAE